MARLPDANTAFGGLDSFNSRRPIASYDDSAIARGGIAMGDAIDKGTDKLAAGFNAIAKDANEVVKDNTALELGKANAHFVAGQIDLNSEFDRDTDYATAQERYKARLDKLKAEAEGMVSSPGAREKLQIHLADDIARGNARISGQVFQREGQAQTGYVLEQLDNLVQKTPGVADPVERNRALDAGHGMIDGLVQSGRVTPVQALSMKRQFADQYIGANANELIRQDPEAALRTFQAPDQKSIYGHLGNDQLQVLQNRARSQLNAQALDEARAARYQETVIKKNSDDREQEYLKDIYGDTPKTTAKDIVNDDMLSRESKERMVRLVAHELKPETDAKISNRNYVGLLQDLRDGKITDTAPIFDARIAGKLNRADFNQALKDFGEMRTPEGDRLNKRKADFVKGVEAQIDHSNPLMGKIDQTGKQQLYHFNLDIGRKIDEYRKAGKDPYDLFDPSKPADYLGKPEALAPYQKTLQQSLQDRVRQVAPPTVNLTGPGKEVLGISVENKFAPPTKWQYSPSRKQYRDPATNKVYDINGNEVKHD